MTKDPSLLRLLAGPLAWIVAVALCVGVLSMVADGRPLSSFGFGLGFTIAGVYMGPVIGLGGLAMALWGDRRRRPVVRIVSLALNIGFVLLGLFLWSNP